jgi:surfeit locus 1 family protein
VTAAVQTRGRRLALPAASTLLMLAVLCALGVWQVRRLQWKTALLARIDAAEQSPGVPLPATPTAFQKVRVTGHLQPSVGRYAVDVRDTPKGPLIGSQVAAILDRGDGPPVVTLLGWLPDEDRYTPPATETTIAGYIRPPVRPGWFTPKDDVPGRHFYTLDPAVIGAALGAGRVAPFTLVRMGPGAGPGQPIPDTAMPRPPNDHLQYAITWFGLAAVLLVIFGAYARKTLAA